MCCNLDHANARIEQRAQKSFALQGLDRQSHAPANSAYSKTISRRITPRAAAREGAHDHREVTGVVGYHLRSSCQRQDEVSRNSRTDQARTAGFTHGWFTATLLTEHNVVNRHSDAQVTSAIVQLQSAGPSLTMIRRRL